MKLIESEFVSTDVRRTLTQLLTADIKQINSYEAKRGAVLGNHYHNETLEYFYITKGTVLVKTKHVGNHVSHEQVINKGNLFVVGHGEIHTVECLTDVSMLTFLTKPFDKDKPDTYKDE